MESFSHFLRCWRRVLFVGVGSQSLRPGRTIAWHQALCPDKTQVSRCCHSSNHGDSLLDPFFDSPMQTPAPNSRRRPADTWIQTAAVCSKSAIANAPLPHCFKSIDSGSRLDENPLNPQPIGNRLRDPPSPTGAIREGVPAAHRMGGGQKR